MSSKYTEQDYIDYIKLMLTGGVLDLEIPDKSLALYVRQALQEVQRYIDETKLITVPYSPCIDLKGFKHSAIMNVYRTQGFTGNTGEGIQTSDVDPMYAQTWMAFSNGGATYNLQNYMMNYLSYNALLQIRNTMSTDMSFREDKHNCKLYINNNYDAPKFVTIEYIPIFDDVEILTSDYWIDILKRMSLAMVKIALGRIRTRFTQSNAVWTQDGETLLNEGNTELTELRTQLVTNTDIFVVHD